MQGHDDAGRYGDHRHGWQEGVWAAQSLLRIADAFDDLSTPHGRERGVPRASADGNWLRGSGGAAEQGVAVRTDSFAGMRSGGALWHAGNSGIGGQHCAVCGWLRRDLAGESWSGELRAGFDDGFLPHGDHRTFRAGGAGDGDAWQAGATFQQRCAEAGGCAGALWIADGAECWAGISGDFGDGGEHRADYFDAAGARGFGGRGCEERPREAVARIFSCVRTDWLQGLKPRPYG